MHGGVRQPGVVGIPQRRWQTHMTAFWALISTLAVFMLQGAAAAADGNPVAVQVVLTGTPGGGLTAFIQLKSGVELGAPLPALYASPQLLAAQPYVSGVSLQPYTGDNPMGALLILADSPVETVFQDSVFYRLPAPALAIVNSTARLNNTEGDQKFAGGRLLVMTGGSSMAVTDSVFQGAQQDGDGGVVWMQSSMLDVKNVTFFDNSATGSGGAIYADTDSVLSGLASTFANNSAGSEGGAIYHNGFFPSMQLGHANFSEPGPDIRAFSAAKVAFTNISFVRNTAATGGGLLQEYVSGSLVDCQFSGNTADAIGGGLAQASSMVDVVNGSFFGNIASQHGGAVFQINAIGSVSGAMFAGNTAGKNGGGLARVHCMGDLNGSSFSDNSGLLGGSVYIDGSIADNLYSNQFVNGNASAAGGGMYLRGSTVQLADSMAFMNSMAQNGAGWYSEGTSIGAISNTVFLNGVATEDGGGLSLNGTTVMSLLYDTFQNNTAARGGGISAISSQLTIASTKFINNTAGSSGTSGYALFSDDGQVTLGINNVYDPPELSLSISK